METLLPFILVAVETVQAHSVLTILFVLLIAITIHSISLSRRIKKLTAGANGASLESTIQGLDKRTSRLEGTERERARVIADIERRLARSMQGVSVERFDPFQQASGQQSFATALLNEHGSGVVISGIHARDGVRVYAKEVHNFTSDRELSEEEERAILKAQEKLKV